MEGFRLNLVRAPEPLFELIAVEPIRVEGPDELLDQDLMSPFVWRTADGGLGVLLRAVPRLWRPGDCTGTIWHGRCGEHGCHFVMDDHPLLVPGPGQFDVGGCEDPTVVPDGEQCVVYYTGLDADGNGRMLYAEGPHIGALTKMGIALASSKTERNTKEASVERTSSGEWRLFYEYSRRLQSRVGLACGKGPRGPWDEQPDPFDPRPDCWDSWHISTGPLLMSDPDAPVMFYNGADRDAVWGVGWVVFDRNCTRVVARSQAPLIAPPPQPTDGRDISFAASAIEAEQEIWLYLSKNDRRVFRARVRQNRGLR
jgi:predicted GH43/DUF377 family glycosyl hydrolase